MYNLTFSNQHSTFAAGVGIPFETKMKDLSQALYQQMEQATELDTVICKNLKDLGYGK
jgi:type I restriction enzyme M protein